MKQKLQMLWNLPQVTSSCSFKMTLVLQQKTLINKAIYCTKTQIQ